MQGKQQLGTAAACALMLVASTSQAAPEAAVSSGAFVDSIGVNIHATHFQGFPSTTYDDWNGVIGALQNLGIKNVRDHVFDVGRLNQLTAATGAKVDGILEADYFPNGVLTLDPSTVPAQIALAKSVNGLVAVEGPNEYDQFPGFSISGLTQYQQLIYNGVRSDPTLSNIKVIAPSLTDRSSFSSFSSLAAYTDAGNIHSYPLTYIPSFGLTSWQTAAAQMVGAKPVWATETGYHVSTLLNQPFDISPAASAKYIPRLLMDDYTAGVQKTFLYELANDNVDPTNSNAENNLGLVNTDFTLRPAGAAVKNLISLLGDTTAGAAGSLDYTITGGNSYLRHMLLQRADGKFILALWQDVSVFDKSTNGDLTNADLPITLSFNTPIAGVKTYLPNGSISPVSSYGAVSQLGLTVPDQVMLVEISVPEPSGMLVVGVAMLGLMRRRMAR